MKSSFEFGRSIKRFREKHGLSQEEFRLTFAPEFTLKAIQAWEQHVRHPTMYVQNDLNEKMRKAYKEIAL